ncbi:hypothetical protein BC835DRAFT_1266664 [Cytidiella melzeri]|nr:hypothetical protein BC835DRAFT_1266664 [Cytidiella melzeri]
MKATIRAAKAVTKGYSDAQSKVRDATKNDSSSPSARELDEIAHLSYSRPDFIEIMELVDKRLNDKGKLWRHVYKALAVINHLLHAGSPQVYHYCHNNLYVFKTLREFQYIDDAGMDVGQTVRSEAKEVTTLLLSPEELKSRRRRGPGSTSFNDRVRGTPRRERPNSDPRQSAQQGKRQRSEEDGDLARAIELSKSVEEERLRKIRDSNNGGLFDLVPEYVLLCMSWTYSV